MSGAYISKARKNIDFTSGNMVKNLIFFAIPIFFGELLQNLYNSVDALIVGNFVGENALAAVSVCDILSRLVVGFFIGMSIGASVVVSRAFGSKDPARLKNTMNAVFVFSLLLGVVISVLGMVFTPFLIKLCNVPDGVYGESLRYLRIYMAGVIFTIAYNVSAGILRACGDSRSTLIILIVSSVLNIVLNILLVTVIPLGVAGVALATVIAQMVSVIVAYYRIKKLNSDFRLISPIQLRGNKKTIAELMKIGLPSGTQSSIIIFSNLFVWRYIGSFGSAAMAAVGVAQKVDRIAEMPAKAFGLSLTTFISQNVGAQNYERAKQGIVRTAVLAAVTTAIFSITMYALAENLVILFSDSQEVAEIGADMIRTILPFYATVVLRDVMLGTMRGYGYTRVPMILILTGMVAVRQTYLGIALSISHTMKVVFYGYPLAWGATAVMLFVYYIYLLRKNKLPV